MEKQRIYKRPKTREDMFKLFEQVFYEVRHWYANGNKQEGLAKHIRDIFKKRPSDLTGDDLAKANTMTLDEWMEFAKDKYVKHLERESERMREKKKTQPHPFGEVKPLPINNTPMDELLPGFENEPKPVQTSIDFDKERLADNIGEFIIIGRQVAKALEALVEIDRERNELYREWLAINKVYPTTPRPRPRGTGATMAIKDPFAC